MGGRGPPDRGGLGERSSPSVAVVEGLPVPREPACADERSQDGEAKSASSERMPRRHPRTSGERGTGTPVWWSHHACPFGRLFRATLSGDSPIHLSSAQRSRSGGCSTSVGDFASAAPGRSRHGPPWRNIPARRQPPARRGSPPRRLSFLGFLGHFAGWPDFPAGFSQFLGDSAVPRPPKKPLAKPSAIRYYTRVQCSFPRQIARFMVAKQPPRRRAGNRGRQQP
jgi:hypothetical protein